MKSTKAGVVAGIASIAGLGLMATVATTAQEQQTFDGKWRYYASCSGCHGEKGEGIYAFGPALKGNPFVQNAPEPALTEVIQKGRNYAQRTHLAYVGMPAYPYLRGGDVSALIQYMKGEMQQQ